ETHAHRDARCHARPLACRRDRAEGQGTARLALSALWAPLRYELTTSSPPASIMLRLSIYGSLKHPAQGRVPTILILSIGDHRTESQGDRINPPRPPLDRISRFLRLRQ